jgi:flagellar biosynthesis component FlhA
MNYGLSIIVLSILDILVIFSGLPTGWKKAFILIISLALLLIGWMIRTVEQRKKLRAKMRAESIEESFSPELETVAHTIAHDVSENVEYEVQEIAETSENLHHHTHHTYEQEETLFE